MANEASLSQLFQINVKCFAVTGCLLSIALQNGFGKGWSGVDSVHVDAERTQGVRQRFRQRDAGDVAGWSADSGTGRAPSAAAEIDNPAPASLFHIWGSLAGAAEVAEEFLLEVFYDLL